MASRCCGSGWNLELEAPLETAIEGRIAELEKEKMPSKCRLATQAICYVGSLISVWMTMSALDGSEFVGGRITGPSLNLSDAGLLLFCLALLLLFWFPRLSAVIAIAASLLVSPLLLYFLAPGFSRRIFKGEWAVPLNSSFAWNMWAALGIVAVLAVLIVSVRSLCGIGGRKYSQ